MFRIRRSTPLFASLIAAAVIGGAARQVLAGPIFATETSRISFQALLTDANDNPLPDGPVNLTFNVYHPVQGLVEGPIPVATAITGGVVNVFVPVSRSSWDGGARELGVSVNGDPEMAPRIPLVSVPHAYRVDRVENEELTNDVILGDTAAKGSLVILRANGTTSIEMDGATGTIRTEKNGVTRFSANEDGNVDVYGLTGSLAGRFFPDANGGRLQTFASGQATSLLGGSFSGGGFMEIYQQSGGLGLSLDGDQSVGTSGNDEGGAIKGYNGLGQNTFVITADENNSNAAVLTLRDQNTTTAKLTGKGSGGGGGLNLFNDAGIETLQLDGDEDDAGEMILFDASGEGTLHADGDDGSNGARLALGNGARETIRLDAGAGGGAGGPGGPEIRLWNPAGSEVFRVNGSGGTNEPEMFLRNGSGTDIFSFWAHNGTGGRMNLAHGADTRFRLYANSNNAARIEMNTGNSTAVVLEGEDNNGAAALALYNGSSKAVDIEANDGNGSARITLERAGETGIVIDADQAGNLGAYMEMRNSQGNPVIVFNTNYNGDARIVTEELQITGGSDLSEQFEINADAAKIEPGSVVCIDPNDAGSLVISSRAYDRTVAGIVSGAGGVKPGMWMGQKDSIADGRHPVALTGRVYCKVDLSNGAIQPGDLLTTSKVPGHCMKVTDHASAQGAIIGKAMSVPSKGLVLVLVALQ